MQGIRAEKIMPSIPCILFFGFGKRRVTDFDLHLRKRRIEL